MSLQKITNKLLLSVKEEIDKPEQMDLLMNDILEPIIRRVLSYLSGYFMKAIILILFMFIAIIIILFLNLKICYFKG